MTLEKFVELYSDVTILVANAAIKKGSFKEFTREEVLEHLASRPNITVPVALSSGIIDSRQAKELMEYIRQ